MMKIFLLDDDPHTLRLLQLSLEAEGYEVLAESDSRKGLRRIQDELPDLVILDIMMPGLDGFEVTRRLREDPRTERLPIMVFSSRAGVYDRVKALNLGANDYMTKPADLTEIIARVGTLLTLEEGRFVGHGRVTVCIGVKGGVGTTTVATNVATSLAMGEERAVVLVDGYLQFGGVQTALNIRSPHSLSDLLPYTAHMDSELVSSVLAPHHSGLQVLLAPSEHHEPVMPEPAHAESLLTKLREMFDQIVVDVWPFLNPVTLAILDEADVILLVLTPEISSLHNARLWLQLADERGYSPSRLHLVLNQDTGQKGFLEGEISRLLSYPLFHHLPFEPLLVRDSLNRGVPLVLTPKGGRLAQSFVRLAERVRGLESVVPGLSPRQPQRGFSGLKKAVARV